MKRNSDVNFLEPDEETTSISSLTKRHKGAIRAIRKLKYLVAKRKFKEALKPYDIKVSSKTFNEYYLQHIELEPDTIYNNIIVRYHIGFESSLSA